MKEEFLHYLWKYQLYYRDKLFDSEGNRITVINPGEYNRDSGPDFFNARIMAGGTLWAGNVEIHSKASHFEIHGHQNDPAFDNVILHVVAENDRIVCNSRGEELTTVVLAYDQALYEDYINLINNPFVIACQNEIAGVDASLKRTLLNTLVNERLGQKAGSIIDIFTETGNDWDETFYRILIRYFGFRVNTEPFGMLARALPFRIIRKHADNRFQIEALLFGTAGMLEEGLFREALPDDYYRDLIKEYRILAAKYALVPVHGWLWKFARLRPANFPTVRISQLAVMLSEAGGLFSRVIEAGECNQLRKLFEVTASEYWDTHFIFGKKSRRAVKCTGDQAAGLLLINAVIPVLFAYGRSHGSREICDRAIGFLMETASEENVIISEWKVAGLESGSAFDSQALIHLRNEYCRKRRCLDCLIGSYLVSRGARLKDQEELLLEP